ncbi:MAG: nucleotidyltransferase domain-containing protein [Planctomycetota bacterium]
MPTAHPDQSGQGLDAAVDAIRPVVHARLRAIEADRNLRVIFACESGSRAWGFASSDSDFDVRFIYVRPSSAYLKLKPPADAFDIHDDSEHDLDLAGWDIRKTAELMRKSNGPLFEWLDSPIIYEQDGRITPLLIQLRDDYFDAKKTTYHYLSLAARVWKSYLLDQPNPVRKKYLYTLRPLACVEFIRAHGTQPPTRFQSVLDAISLEPSVSQAIRNLVTDKQANRELGAAPADPILNAWITETLESGDRLAAELEPNPIDNTLLDQLIADAILTPDPHA